jgi:hypothetical protein
MGSPAERSGRDIARSRELLAALERRIEEWRLTVSVFRLVAAAESSRKERPDAEAREPSTRG